MSTQAPPRSTPSSNANTENQRPRPTALQIPESNASNSNSTLRPEVVISQAIPKKKRNHRGGRKKRTRKQSFAVSTEDGSGMLETSQSHRRGPSESAVRNSFYRLQGRNLSNTSIESEALLDHR
jgi:magnesium transporter